MNGGLLRTRRCEATHPLDPHMQCAGKPGHGGIHWFGEIAWSDGDRAPGGETDG